MITENSTLFLAITILILEFCLFSPNIVYFIHQSHFDWKPKKENLALVVLKEVYPQGDDYHSHENNDTWWASFSNYKPLQHGEGWDLRINKKTYKFTTTGDSKCYHDKIKQIIKSKI